MLKYFPERGKFMIYTPGLSINFLKKENYSGSHAGMRFYLGKEDDKLKAYVYPEPFCFEATPEEDKKWAEFAFSAEGLEEAIGWLDEMHQQFSEVTQQIGT